MKKSTLPIKLNLNSIQQGAISCKRDMILMTERLNTVECSDLDGEFVPSMVLEERNSIIEEILSKLGEINEFQKGYISSLLEFAEFSTNGGDEAKSWRPSLITGKWQ